MDNTKEFYLTTAVIEFGIIIVLVLYLLVKYLKGKAAKMNESFGGKR